MALTTITAISLGLAALSTGIGVYSAVSSAAAASDAAEYNAKVAENNALAAAQQAEYEANQIKQRNRRLIGRQRVALAKAGVIGNTAADLLTDSTVQGDLDVQAAYYKGHVGSSAEVSSGRLYRAQGKNAKATGAFSAVGSLVGGAASGVDSYYRYEVMPTLK